MKIKTLTSYLILFIFCFTSLAAVHSYAQPSDDAESFDYMLKNYSDKLRRFDDGPGAKRKSNNPDKTPSRYIYETPTVKALSHLYWAVNMYKVEDDEAVDEFMRINECDIYKNFHSDEVEWQDIRNATRDFLIENKEDFPTRFEFVMPLQLGDYNEKRGAFEIQKGFQINSLRRFELFASDLRTAEARACSRDHLIASGYPRVIVLEFSRPFNLVYIPTKQDLALSYIKRKLDFMKNNYDPRGHSKDLMYKLRKAYLVIKVKIFTYGKFLGLNYYKLPMVQMMGVLEGYEVYEDANKEHLFYAQNYVTNQKKGKLDERLTPQYEFLRKKSSNKGMLH
tara:strand:- start:3852 stop:4862 length:1011 start_codon:yes stop_codon:yes gene_type:complete